MGEPRQEGGTINGKTGQSLFENRSQTTGCECCDRGQGTPRCGEIEGGMALLERVLSRGGGPGTEALLQIYGSLDEGER